MSTPEDSAEPPARTVPAGRVLRLLVVGMLVVALIDLVLVVAVIGGFSSATAHPGRSSGSLTPLLWGAVGAIVGVGVLLVIVTAVVVVVLLTVRSVRGPAQR